jgi:hypothetical protein
MAKRGRPVTNSRTAEKKILENPPPYIVARRSRRKGVSFTCKKFWCTTERHHARVEALRQKLQVSRDNLDLILAGYSEGCTDAQLEEAWSVIEKRLQKIVHDVSAGGRARANRFKPNWHSEAMRLADEIRLSRGHVEIKLSGSSMADLILQRWTHPTIKKPSKRSIRSYLAKSI